LIGFFLLLLLLLLLLILLLLGFPTPSLSIQANLVCGNIV
jgi:hypothetical protein